MVESAAAPTADEVFALLNPFSEATPDPATASAHPASAWANPAVTLARITPEERLALLGNDQPLRTEYRRFLAIRDIFLGKNVPPPERLGIAVERAVQLRISELRLAQFRADIGTADGEPVRLFLRCFDETVERAATRHQPDKLRSSSPESMRRDFHRAQMLVAVTQLWPIVGNEAKLSHIDTLVAFLDPRLDPEYTDQSAAKEQLRRRVEEEREDWERGDRTRATPTYEAVRRDILREAIALVLSHRKERQRHRFGSEWVRDEGGDLDAFVPWSPDAHAPWGGAWLDYWDWFADEVDKAFVAILLERPYPSREGNDGRQRAEAYERLDKDTFVPVRDLILALERDPALALIERDAARDLLLLLRERLTGRPRDCEVFDLLAAGHTVKEMALLLDRLPNAVSQSLARIRREARALREELDNVAV
jgi:hypothetical protein